MAQNWLRPTAPGKGSEVVVVLLPHLHCCSLPSLARVGLTAEESPSVQKPRRLSVRGMNTPSSSDLIDTTGHLVQMALLLPPTGGSPYLSRQKSFQASELLENHLESLFIHDPLSNEIPMSMQLSKAGCTLMVFMMVPRMVLPSYDSSSSNSPRRDWNTWFMIFLT